LVRLPFIGIIRIVILFNNLPFGVICSAKTVLSTSLKQINPAITMVNQKVFTWGKYFVKECRIQQASPTEPMPALDIEICSGVSVDAISRDVRSDP